MLSSWQTLLPARKSRQQNRVNDGGRNEALCLRRRDKAINDGLNDHRSGSADWCAEIVSRSARAVKNSLHKAVAETDPVGIGTRAGGEKIRAC
jgi:hypothetical protein